MLDALKKTVGAENVREGMPVVVRPGNEEEVSRVVAIAHEGGKVVRPKGGGTRLAPDGADVVVELSRLDAVEHSPNDMVVSAGAGVRFPELQRALAAKGQRIPLDPSCGEGSTLGGVLASNAFGPLRLKHGTARDWVLGTTLVRFDGKIVHAGGIVVKNVSGYDLNKLYIGSWGSLGILVRVSLKLAPLPKAEGTLLLEGIPRAEADRYASELRDGPFPLVSAVFDGKRLLLGFEGLPGVLDGQVRAVREKSVYPSRWFPGGIPGVERPSTFVLLLHYPPAAYVALLDELMPEAEERSLLGCGVTRLDWARTPSEETVRRIRKVCARHGGWAATERPALSWEIPAPSLDAMSRLKAALDPQGTFGPLPGVTS